MPFFNHLAQKTTTKTFSLEDMFWDCTIRKYWKHTWSKRHHCLWSLACEGTGIFTTEQVVSGTWHVRRGIVEYSMWTEQERWINTSWLSAGVYWCTRLNSKRTCKNPAPFYLLFTISVFVTHSHKSFNCCTRFDQICKRARRANLLSRIFSYSMKALYRAV